MRTTRRTVTFTKPFVLGDGDEVLPEGVYDVETDEELIDGLSFIAYRRVATFVQLQPQAGCTRTITVDPNAFDEAVARDEAGTSVGAGP